MVDSFEWGYCDSASNGDDDDWFGDSSFEHDESPRGRSSFRMPLGQSRSKKRRLNEACSTPSMSGEMPEALSQAEMPSQSFLRDTNHIILAPQAILEVLVLGLSKDASENIRRSNKAIGDENELIWRKTVVFVLCRMGDETAVEKAARSCSQANDLVKIADDKLKMVRIFRGLCEYPDLLILNLPQVTLEAMDNWVREMDMAAPRDEMQE
ncbi:hypothetical protein MCOR17_003343 [Pyricularia oryzae]|nr:hypothetical protein MCOR17_003343 [Pyricularia oryzae]